MRHFGKSDANSEPQTTQDIVSPERRKGSQFAINMTDTQRFLDVLSAGRPVTLQTFSDRDELKKSAGGKLYDPNAWWFHGTLAKLVTTLKHLNSRGAGIFVTINEGNGEGRSAVHVVSVRAIFADFDGAPLPNGFPLEPHLIVESSPGKYHVYWLTVGISLADFSTHQTALADHFGSDRAVTDLPRVMRLPGFLHQKAEPVLVKLLQAHDLPRYALAELYDAWPFLADRLECKRTQKAAEVQRRTEALQRAAERRARPVGTGQRLLEAHHGTVAGAAEGTRHETLKNAAIALGGYIGGGYLEPLEVEEMLRDAARVCGLPDAETDKVIRWGLVKGAERPLELPDFPQYHSETTYSEKQSPWVSQKDDFTNSNATQRGSGWDDGESPWQ